LFRKLFLKRFKQKIKQLDDELEKWNKLDQA
jgi:hypothetical protein